MPLWPEWAKMSAIDLGKAQNFLGPRSQTKARQNLTGERFFPVVDLEYCKRLMYRMQSAGCGNGKQNVAQ